jgi:transcriptional regulator with XRE-family HTH domain
VNDEIRTVIREAMTQQELSQVELAKRLGISPSALSQILTNKRGTIPESLLISC